MTARNPYIDTRSGNVDIDDDKRKDDDQHMRKGKRKKE